MPRQPSTGRCLIEFPPRCSQSLELLLDGWLPRELGFASEEPEEFNPATSFNLLHLPEETVIKFKRVSPAVMNKMIDWATVRMNTWVAGPLSLV